jgi:protein-tyrosine-phosphatase
MQRLFPPPFAFPGASERRPFERRIAAIYIARMPARRSPEAVRADLRVLFLCTHNSARSQMAEGLLRSLSTGRIATFSAGTEPSRVHPLAIRALAAEGIDIREQRSKHLEEYTGERFDYVITVCDRAGETCPVFPGGPERIHWSIPDPSAVAGPPEVQLEAFREAAIDLRTRIRRFLEPLGL